MMRLYLAEESDRLLSEHAERLDRSRSWIMKKCWALQRDRLAALAPDSDELRRIKAESPGRHPLRQQALKVHALDPDSHDAPKGMAAVTIFGLAEHLDELDAEGERLGLATWEILDWALQQSTAELAALPPAAPLPG